MRTLPSNKSNKISQIRKSQQNLVRTFWILSQLIFIKSFLSFKLFDTTLLKGWDIIIYSYNINYLIHNYTLYIKSSTSLSFSAVTSYGHEKEHLLFS